MRVDRRILRACVAIALALSLAPLSSAQTPRSDKLSISRIDNFGCINENYYRGAQPQRGDYSDLAALGVRTIIDLQRDGEADEQKRVESLGMKFYRIGMTTRSGPSHEQVSQFLAIVTDPSSQPVFVHCRGGRHRTGVMTAIYRLVHDGWAAAQAYTEMKKYEFEKGLGHGALKDFVFDYYRQTDRQNATDTQRSVKAASGNR
jgi:protein tyrosine/serine phosphatase